MTTDTASVFDFNQFASLIDMMLWCQGTVGGMITVVDQSIAAYEDRQREDRESIECRRIFKKGEEMDEDEPSSSKERLVKSLQVQKVR